MTTTTTTTTTMTVEELQDACNVLFIPEDYSRDYKANDSDKLVDVLDDKGYKTIEEWMLKENRARFVAETYTPEHAAPCAREWFEESRRVYAHGQVEFEELRRAFYTYFFTMANHQKRLFENDRKRKGCDEASNPEPKEQKLAVDEAKPDQEAKPDDSST